MDLKYEKLSDIGALPLSPKPPPCGAIYVKYAGDGESQSEFAAPTSPGHKPELASRTPKLISVGATTPRAARGIGGFKCGVQVQTDCTMGW